MSELSDRMSRDVSSILFPGSALSLVTCFPQKTNNGDGIYNNSRFFSQVGRPAKIPGQRVYFGLIFLVRFFIKKKMNKPR